MAHCKFVGQLHMFLSGLSYSKNWMRAFWLRKLWRCLRPALTAT